ncbi:MAG: NAD-dependent succinate-semialdehyde dehydrogenase [Betaproteobacteria bacterium]|nr:NAD-dependent succinate-semialdehyde dehydrogenase [Betaproteobacteria bacterium]
MSVSLEPEATTLPVPRILINGEWREGNGDTQWTLLNPATGQALSNCRSATPNDLNIALMAAQQALKPWGQTPAFQRAQLIEQGLQKVLGSIDEMSRWLTLEQGKTLGESRLEVQVAVEMVRWFAQEGRRIHGRTIPSRLPQGVVTVMPRPAGVALAISPWNYPVILCARKVGAALAAGCSVIAKLPEETPVAVGAFLSALNQALPPGVLQAVFGDAKALCSQAIASPVVRKVSFTGSVAVGRALAHQCSTDFKRSTLELGGHAPVIVCRDAPLESVANMLVAHKHRNAGQACMAPSRLYVDRDVLPAFTDHYVAAMRRLRVGSGIKADIDMGPVQSHRRQAAIESLIEDARAHGADVVEGPSVEGPGFFVPPTVLLGNLEGARVMQDEPFGPVCAIQGFSTLDEAIARANANRLGLAGYLFTDSASIQARCMRELEVGALSINNVMVSMPEAPFGGLKDSGLGAESGIEGLSAYLDPMSVHTTPMAP